MRNRLLTLHDRHPRILLLLVGTVAFLFLGSCGGGPVEPARVVSVDITPDQLTLEIGQSPSRLTATVEATGGASQAVYWASDAPAVATVTPIGDVSPVAPGTARITATSIEDPTKNDAILVTVTEGDDVVSVAVNGGDLLIEVGDVTTLTATVVASGDASHSVFWESDDPLVATIDSATGRLEAVGEGFATIKATSVDTPSTFDTIVVTVVDPVAAVIERCDLASEPTPLYRDASAALIEAARTGSLPVADDTLLVAYQTPSTSTSGLLGAHASDPTLIQSVRDRYGLHVLATVAPGLDRVRATDPWTTAQELLRDDRVRYAHPNVVLTPSDVPDDPHFREQWSLANLGASAAWDVETGASAVTVAILDAGVDASHPDLSSRLDPGWDFYDGDADTYSAEVHGTHVTGIIGAAGDNALGITGVTRTGVRLLPVKVFDDTGGDAEGRAVTAVVDGLLWSAGYPVAGPEQRTSPVQVANLSIGTSVSYTIIPALEDAIRAARARGVVVFAAAGNDGATDGMSAPANGPCAIAVGSIDEDLSPSSFSNYAADGRTVDVVAPGGTGDSGRSVLSTTPGGGYAYLTGTSMATAYASGSAALLASHQPTWDGTRLLEEVLRRVHLPTGADPAQVGLGVTCLDALLGAEANCGLP